MGWGCLTTNTGPFTLSLLGETHSSSLSQDCALSVPNGAARGCRSALVRPSGDVALLPLQDKQNTDNPWAPAADGCAALESLGAGRQGAGGQHNKRVSLERSDAISLALRGMGVWGSSVCSDCFVR